MSDTKPEEEITRLKRLAYRRRCQREYYLKRIQNPEYVEKRRQKAREMYNYERTTIDCSSCGVRHKPDSVNCLRLVTARSAAGVQALLGAIDKKPPE